jgi:hypothetical protein
MSFNTNSQDRAFFQRSPEQKAASIKNRIRSIAHRNDPTTYADEVLAGSKIVQVLLLTFTAAMSAFSYYYNFEVSFGSTLAMVFAASLAIAIEFGKNRAAVWALRTLFFSSDTLKRSAASFFIFCGVLSVAGVTYYMSYINSTKGAQQVSLLLASEKTRVDFTPNTADIDAQITAAQGRIAKNNGNTYKKKVAVWSQQSNIQESATISQLTKQRADVIAQQREDYLKRESEKNANHNQAAGLLLAAGGWVELLQALLTLIMVACEKKLLDNMEHERPTNRGNPNPTPNGNNHQYFDHARTNGAPQNAYNPDVYTPAGFKQGYSVGNPPEFLFKQTGYVFKQLFDDNGKVAGLMYKSPHSEKYSTIDMPQARSRITTYQKREGNEQNVEMWKYALSLFNQHETV